MRNVNDANDSSISGTIIFNSSLSIKLIENAIFEPPCKGASRPPNVNAHEPFYASTFPQMYAIAAATVISYLLLIMLFITPRTFFIGGRGGGFLSRHGMISGSYGSSSVIGVGGRPWLQKVAALTVVVSLTIATADSFAVAKRQYERGYMDSMALTEEVVNGLEIRVIRVISSTFLWLAQVQTLIRLFPRHKEKVIIKWVGFAMIVLDTIFSILNNTIRKSGTMVVRPRQIVDAIPALNYLFELSLSLLYAAWVIFYSISKHRFAFFHVNMRNICLVALLSLMAVLIPVVFFILDVSKPNVAGWGEYIRWVGAAAASVVVWEWVERIEALERDERKDGILGREIFDGDEMLEVTPSEEGDSSADRGGDNDQKWFGKRIRWARMAGVARGPLKHRLKIQGKPHQRRRKRHKTVRTEKSDPSGGEDPTVPPQAITPVSRADTASTIYRVRYHSIASLSPSIREMTPSGDGQKELTSMRTKDNEHKTEFTRSSLNEPPLRQGIGWLSAMNPFRRRRGSPPQEVASAQAEEGNIQHPIQAPKEEAIQTQSSLKSHFEGFRSLLHQNRGGEVGETQRAGSILPVTVIPARSHRERNIQQNQPPRSSTWRSTNNRSRDGDAAEPELPIVVVPARPRIAKAWDISAFEEYVRTDPNQPQREGPQHDTEPNGPQVTHPPVNFAPGLDTTGEPEDVGSASLGSSSGRTLANTLSPTLGAGREPSQSSSPPNVSSRSPSRLWDDSGGPRGVP